MLFIISLCLPLHLRMMWKCAFPFLAALLTVGLAQVPGGVTDISANDEGVQAALKFAMEEYNKGTSDQYLFKVEEVIKAQVQVSNILLICNNI